MLTIRATQMQALRESAALACVPLLVEHARRFHAGRFQHLSLSELEAHLRGVAERGIAYGLDNPRALARFLDVAATVGLPLSAEFDHLLTHPSWETPGSRLDRTWRHLLFHLERSGAS